jgi:hypothetical protein
MPAQDFGGNEEIAGGTVGEDAEIRTAHGKRYFQSTSGLEVLDRHLLLCSGGGAQNGGVVTVLECA